MDGNKETYVALAARLGIMLSTLKTTIKSRKDTNKCYAQCGRCVGHGEIVKQSPFQALESRLATWLKQARGSSAVISGTLPREKSLPHCHKVGH
jgi:hypothetical protein